MMLLGAMAFSSCDMDLKPVGTLDEETAIQSTQDMRKFRNTLYTNLRSVTSGAFVYHRYPARRFQWSYQQR